MTDHSPRLLVTGACFWTLEAVFGRLAGVRACMVGHVWMAGGLPAQESTQRFPAERMEALAFDWDPSALPPHAVVQVLLETTSAHLAGWEVLDELSGMRSMIAGIPVGLLERFAEALEAIGSSKESRPHTQLLTATPGFQEAPAFDQRFHERKPGDGFCRSIIAPKLERLASIVPQWMAPPRA